ncbi:MAG: TonB-dependent receptor [Spirochaetes bacterium]|nr:TonB-dependent receptor [Spirochaetota bacterium]MBN2770214.1 TonB-dependent receptor [Spirochaetota bacterium]
MRYFIVIIFIFTCGTLTAGTVSGKVTDTAGRPVAGLVVGLDNNFYTAETASDGSFVFENVEPGDYYLHLSNATWGHHRFGIRVKSNFRAVFEISKKQNSADPVEINEVPPLFDTRYRISNEQITRYPMRGIGDSMHLLQTIPGVGGGYSLASVPIIRSTNPLLNKYYIDGIPINNPYHFALSFAPVISAISDPAIDQVVLYKGDAPVRMGDSSGNVIDIRTTEPSQNGIRGKVILDGILPILPTVAVMGVIDPRWSVVAVGRRSTSDVLLDVEDNNYFLQDYYLKTTYVLNDSHRFRFIANGAGETFKWDDALSESGYSLFALQWDYRINRVFYLETSLSRYQINRELDIDVENGASIVFDPVEYRVYQSLSAGIGSFAVSGGYEYTSYSNGVVSNISMEGLATPDILSSEAETESTEFAIDGYGLRFFADFSARIDRVWLLAGVNYDKFEVQNNSDFGYQAELGFNAYRTTSVYIKAGRFIAHPDMIYYLGAVDADSENPEMVTPAQLKNTITETYSLGVISYDLLKTRLQAEFFFTTHQNLFPGGSIVTVNDDSYRKAAQLHKFALEDDGYTYGLELGANRNFLRRYNATVAYTFQSSTRNLENDNRYVELFGDNAKEINSEYNQSHILRLMADARFGRWVPALLFNAYSSLPYTEVTGSREIEGLGTQTLYGKENDARYSMHHRLDAKVNYYASDGLRFYAEIWNIYLNRENQIADYKNRSHREVYNLPVFFWMGMELCF